MNGYLPNFAVKVVDFITCDKTFSDMLRDVDSVGVKNEGFHLNKPMAVNTGLRNCATCDLIGLLD